MMNLYFVERDEYRSPKLGLVRASSEEEALEKVRVHLLGHPLLHKGRDWRGPERVSSARAITISEQDMEMRGEHGEYSHVGALRLRVKSSFPEKPRGDCLSHFFIKVRKVNEEFFLI